MTWQQHWRSRHTCVDTLLLIGAASLVVAAVCTLYSGNYLLTFLCVAVAATDCYVVWMDRTPKAAPVAATA